ncbi:SEN1 N terminal-domain-containing protein [Crassisporium funariophilum]|nr:SEN1 N terminal-domain-containing protein [Crassisporium funariophilum]
MAGSATSKSDVSALLANLRDNPINSDDLTEKVLLQIYTYLMGILPTPSGEHHWFCEQANASTTDAATFLIRLFAYASPLVEKWKERLYQCLSCAFCVQGFELAKVTSKNTFLAAFPTDSLEGFFRSVEQSELEVMLKDISMIDSVSNQQTVLSNVPDILVYRMVSNWTVFCDPRILSVLNRYSPPDRSTGWPKDPLPPGMFGLLIHRNQKLRAWAAAHASNSTLIPHERFAGPYVEALGVVARAVQASLNLSSDHGSNGDATEGVPFDLAEPLALWSGFHAVLKITPPGWLKSTPRQHIDMRRVAFSHLHDKGPHFAQVLKCFILVIKRLGKDIWSGEGPEYPQVVFDAIKDNAAFTELIQSTDPSNSGTWYLAWFQEFLSTIRDHSIYGVILAKVIDFLCEETQHERFRDVRPFMMRTATNILVSDFRRSRRDHDICHLAAVYSALDVHTDTIMAVAYGSAYTLANWELARESARHLVEEVLSVDIKEVKSAIRHLCQVLAQVKKNACLTELPAFSIRTQMWKKLSPTLQTQDTNAVASFIRLTAKTSHLDSIRASVFTSQWKLPAGDRLLDEVNKSLLTFRSGFSAMISRFSDYSVSTSALDVLRCPGVGSAIMLLLLSPVEDLQIAAQTLVGLAFDVDGRMDCFRATLENLTDEAMEGLFDFLTTFHDYAPVVPEACSLSKALVRCFTDVIEVLCTSPDGLLHNQYFLRPNDEKGPASRMPHLWKLMTKALSTIYNRTPMWAPYFDTSDMVVWMRDALILARDLLSQWRVIENASNKYTKSSAKPGTSGKISRIGEEMVGALQEFLPELVRWLRLTDEELLHQSFSLLQSLLDLMKETHIRPSDAGLSKLAKHVEGARKSHLKSREDRTRLDSTRLAKLADVLAYFDDDDEVEIISHTLPTKPRAKQEAQGSDAPGQRPYIQGKGPEVKAPVRSVKSNFVRPALPSSSSRPSGSSKPSTSKFFSARDQQKLDLQGSKPSFRRSAAPTVATGSSKAVVDKQHSQFKPALKNEGDIRTTVSEDSDTSESDTDEDITPGGGLAALGRFPKSPRKIPQKPKQVERRQIKTLDIPTSYNPMQERLLRKKQERNSALRLRPDVSGLHRILLSWDYDHNGPEPPGNKLQLVRVPDRFDNYEHYCRVFQPLLLMECWAQLLQSKDEIQDSYPCKVDSRLFSDDWLEIDLTISSTLRKNWYLTETDVVLLRQLGSNKCIMAKVKSYKSKPTIHLTVRCYTQSGLGDPGLQISTLWQISKIFSLSTLHREYAALMSLQYNDICDFILRPSLPIAAEVDAKVLKDTMDIYKINEPQATAILKALDTSGFSLIQGPPGTGKTSTICSLVARFLSTRSRPGVSIIAPTASAWKTNARELNGRGHQEEKSASGARILLCAPSNAAIDEIAQRIKDGFTGSERRERSVNVVRVGADQAMNPGVRDIALDYLVDQKLDIISKPADLGNEILALRPELIALKQEMDLKQTELKGIHDNSARRLVLENELKELGPKRWELGKRLDRMKDQQRSNNRTLDTLRRNTRREILTKADIVCSTLSGSGHELLADFEFETVVIDEAAQAIELSSLIPLKYGCLRCVMVGDPQQLPPTVLSQEASRLGYNQSLFVRLQRIRKDAVHLLSIQYRMHPDISRLPSRIFYENRLLDGPDMAHKTTQPWHIHKKFGTYRFFNVARGIEENSGRSIKNSTECQVAAELFGRLRQEFSSVNFESRVGVVSMYKAQIVELKRVFLARFKEAALKIDFNTVDGFQGQEKDVIILSCVRAGPGLQSIGFLSDVRRMNVALTRAKSSLFILGNAPTLERSDDTWRQIVHDARSRSSLVDVDLNYFTKAASPPHSTDRPPAKKPRIATNMHPTTLPSDLATPKQLKASVDRSILPTTVPRGVLSATSSQLDPKAQIKEAPPDSIVQLTSGSKRPVDASVASTSTPKPRPEPPRKRQKTQPAMFIPKKRT